MHPKKYLISNTILHVCVHLKLVKGIIARKSSMIWIWNLHPSTSLAESQKAVEAHGYKPSVTNLSIVPHTLGINEFSSECTHSITASLPMTCMHRRIFLLLWTDYQHSKQHNEEENGIVAFWTLPVFTNIPIQERRHFITNKGTLSRMRERVLATRWKHSNVI